MKLWIELNTTLPHYIRSLGATQSHFALTMDEKPSFGRNGEMHAD
ncbi:hypothetical protein T12_15976 [Trichinella patagoniensis]|uniref:Uncharacterized protein n=1 Tax=Trichinella patagoniensis TaxID=990121 RepID=A0A0V0YQ82_9BILA|nr:hypothetical protein T12_15976 [Trichinella patagoniensis]